MSLGDVNLCECGQWNIVAPRSQASPIFVLRFAFSIIHGSGRAAKNASVYYTEHKLNNKNGGGLGTRLGIFYNTIKDISMSSVQATRQTTRALFIG